MSITPVAFDLAGAQRIANVVRAVEGEGAGGKGSKSPLRLEPDPQLGIVVCNGPDGEDSPTTNQYWVQTAMLGSSSGSSGDSSPFPVVPDGTGRIVLATNLNENNCQTHLVPPGTIVQLWFASGTDNTLYWWFEVGDESNCSGSECSSGSSSSSDSSSDVSSGGGDSSSDVSSGGGDSGSSGSSDSSSSGSSDLTTYCVFQWQATYNCTTGELSAVEYQGRFCGTAATYNTWTLLGNGNTDGCVLACYTKGGECSAQDDCNSQTKVQPPALTASAAATICGCGSSSSSAASGSSSSPAACPPGWQTLTVVTGFDPSTCTVTTATLCFAPGTVIIAG